MTIKHDNRMKNHLASKAAGYSAKQTTFVTNLIHQELQQFINHMPFFQQELTNDENQDPNSQTAPNKANAAIINYTIKDLFKSMMKEHKTKNPPKTKPKAQGKDDKDKDITYCHSCGITSNLRHNSTTCSQKKEGHKDAATLNNKLSSNTDGCNITIF
jgi:hypothetical protein